MTALGRTVGIIGAGIAGLVCARTLAANAFDVKVFDKGRGVGGRTATRRAEPDLAFDHGAQYFTARDARFHKVTADWLSRGVVAEWLGCVVRLENGAVTHTSPQPRYVGVPGMTAMAADLASAIRVQTRTQIVAMSRGPSGWTIKTDAHENVGPFETVVVTLPAPQSAEFLQPHAFGAIASTLQMTPCWAVLVAFESKLEVPWDGAFVHNSPLSWVARNSSKPGRSGQSDCWVLHASPEWSAAHSKLLRIRRHGCFWMLSPLRLHNNFHRTVISPPTAGATATVQTPTTDGCCSIPRSDWRCAATGSLVGGLKVHSFQVSEPLTQFATVTA